MWKRGIVEQKHRITSRFVYVLLSMENWIGLKKQFQFQIMKKNTQTQTHKLNIHSIKMYSRRLQSPLSILYADTILRCWFSWSDAFYCCCWCWSFGRSDGRLLYKCAFMQNRKICVLCSLSSHRVRRDGWPKRYGWLKAAVLPSTVCKNHTESLQMCNSSLNWIRECKSEWAHCTLNTVYTMVQQTAPPTTKNDTIFIFFYVFLVSSALFDEIFSY